jgi:hypothetical protein
MDSSYFLCQENFTKTLLSRKQPSIKQGLPVGKKMILTAVCISVLLFSAVAGTQLVNLAGANPFTNSQYAGKTGAPLSAPSPAVSILRPENNKAYNADSITLNFNASVEKFLEFDPSKPVISGMQITKSFFTADWLPNQTQIEIAPYLTMEEDSNKISVALNLTEVPDGKHVLRINVYAEGTITDPIKWYNFETVGYSQVNFTVDTTPPKVTVEPIMNETYTEKEVPEVHLNFTVNEAVSRISYVLDGEENVTIAGNSTLAGLSIGAHNVTVYAADEAGNMGASETVTFTVAVPEPFPVVLVAAVSVAVVVVAIGLLVYFKKRKH